MRTLSNVAELQRTHRIRITPQLAWGLGKWELEELACNLNIEFHDYPFVNAWVQS